MADDSAHMPQAYRERATRVPAAVLWRAEGAGPRTILPDGCLDLLLVGERLRVAGPDTTARTHDGAHAVTGLRLSHGLGPRVLGVPAATLTDRVVDLDELWPARAARELTGRVLERPAATLAALADDAAPDPLAARVFGAAAAGLGVDAIAEHAGCSVRTLHRRCLAAFGYGLRHLVRVLRLQRALATARAGEAWATVAAETGYADQPHLAREVRTLTGRRPGELVPRQDGSGAWRSTGSPSGSRTTA